MICLVGIRESSTVTCAKTSRSEFCKAWLSLAYQGVDPGCTKARKNTKEEG